MTSGLRARAPILVVLAAAGLVGLRWYASASAPDPSRAPAESAEPATEAPPEALARARADADARGRGPSVGDQAPRVVAETLDGGRIVELCCPTRPTVLIFGSWT